MVYDYNNYKLIEVPLMSVLFNQCGENDDFLFSSVERVAGPPSADFYADGTHFETRYYKSNGNLGQYIRNGMVMHSMEEIDRVPWFKWMEKFILKIYIPTNNRMYANGQYFHVIRMQAKQPVLPFIKPKVECVAEDNNVMALIRDAVVQNYLGMDGKYIWACCTAFTMASKEFIIITALCEDNCIKLYLDNSLWFPDEPLEIKQS